MFLFSVYGPSDVNGISINQFIKILILAPRIIIGAVYRKLNEEMKLLWTKDLKLNTVHVRDVAKAIWWVSALTSEKGGRTKPRTGLEVYNLADKNATGNQSNK